MNLSYLCSKREVVADSKKKITLNDLMAVLGVFQNGHQIVRGLFLFLHLRSPYEIDDEKQVGSEGGNLRP